MPPPHHLASTHDLCHDHATRNTNAHAQYRKLTFLSVTNVHTYMPATVEKNTNIGVQILDAWFELNEFVITKVIRDHYWLSKLALIYKTTIMYCIVTETDMRQETKITH